ncbi:TetR/AcrR family transcriptional regulator [Nocardioides sp.]|uniref:TetR/AcrR family transcriptional regulator n=1 Tax=Nocardioides sp. TaxID=35761 RepID=UPI003529B357
MARRPPGQLRADILDATTALLRERLDPALVSIDAVVSAVGCSPPALYYYFPTKEHLLWEACRAQYADFSADLQAMTPTTDDPREDLRARGLAYLTWAREHPAAYRVLFMTRLDLSDPDAPEAPDPGASPDFHDVPGLGDLVRDLERAAAAGHPVGDVNLAAFSLWAIVHGFASLSVTEPAIPVAFLEAGLHRATVGLIPPRQP